MFFTIHVNSKHDLPYSCNKADKMAIKGKTFFRLKTSLKYVKKKQKKHKCGENYVRKSSKMQRKD